MMKSGNGKIALLADQKLWIRSTEPFHVLEVDAEGDPRRVLGPDSAEARAFKIHVREPTAIEIKTEGAWSYELRTFPRCEHPDPTPLEIPLGMSKPETIEEMMARMIRSRFELMATENGYETEDEANDFDVGDPDNWQSPYELTDMQEDSPFFEEASGSDPAQDGIDATVVETGDGAEPETGKGPPDSPAPASS